MSSVVFRLLDRFEPTAVIKTVNDLVKMVTGLGPGRIELLGDDGVKKDYQGNSVSTGNYALHIKAASGLQVLIESASGTDFLDINDTSGPLMSAVLVNGNIAWKSGTAFTVTLDHAATANRVITVPDATDTMALLAAVQTFTNKTLTTPTINGATLSGTLTGSGTVALSGTYQAPIIDPPTVDGQVTNESQCKAFLNYTVAGGVIGNAYNITSVTKNGTGDFTVTINRDFSSAAYAVVATILDNGLNLLWRINGQAAGSFDIHFRTTAGVLSDPVGFNAVCFGTLS